MALRDNYPFNNVVVSSYMADVGTAGSCYVAAPCSGYIVLAQSCIQAAITTADCTWSLEINNVAVTGSTATIAFTGAAAGDVDSVIPTGANYVNAGDTIEFKSNGESSGTAPAIFSAVIRRA